MAESVPVSGLKAVGEFLEESRRRIQTRHQQGASGRQTGSALTQMVDQALGQLYHAALDKLAEPDARAVREQLAIVALGGYGRGDLAPYSDIDLLFLHGRGCPPAVLDFAKGMVRDVWDVGLELGHSVSSIGAVSKLARAETFPATALLESRHLVGCQALLEQLVDRFGRQLGRGLARRLAGQAAAAIREEQGRFGQSIYLLEPNVKRSSGGLREVHLVRWLGKAIHGTADPGELEARGVLATGDAESIERAYDFLLGIRNDLHFHTGRANDNLTRGEQVRIARERGYQDTDSLLAVEQFMRKYFRHTTQLADVAGRFLKKSRPRRLGSGIRNLLLERRCSRGVWLSPERLLVKPHARAEIIGDQARILEVAELAALHDVELDRDTVESLRQAYLPNAQPAGPGFADPAAAALDGPPIEVLAPESARRFLQLLGRPGALHRALRLLHQVGVLGRLIPAFEHARGLLQFNAYHKYTVDEHTLVMLQFAEELAGASSLPGRAYRQIVRKEILHLAILLHDLGKGRAEDHCEVGKRISQATAQRFGLGDEETRTLMFLVHKHLLLTHLAFRRDTSDSRLWVQLAREVQTEQRLHMLFVLTVADVMAVGPGNYNRWRADLLDDLYLRTLDLLAGTGSDTDRTRAIRQELSDRLANEPGARDHFETLPASYVLETPSDLLAEDFTSCRQLQPGQVVTQARYQDLTGQVTWTILTHEQLTSGIFYKICAGLSAHHLEILSARIHTLADGTVIDRFEVKDTHHGGPPSEDRIRRIGDTIRRILTGHVAAEDSLWSSRSSLFLPKKQCLARDATRVVVDNDSSATCTVIDVFTINRRGLLYTLAKGMNRLGLSIQLAKIATYAEEVVDVFYVQEFDGRKVHREDRIRLIQDHLENDIQRLSTDPRSMGF